MQFPAAELLQHPVRLPQAFQLFPGVLHRLLGPLRVLPAGKEQLSAVAHDGAPDAKGFRKLQPPVLRLRTGGYRHQVQPSGIPQEGKGTRRHIALFLPVQVLHRDLLPLGRPAVGIDQRIVQI